MSLEILILVLIPPLLLGLAANKGLLSRNIAIGIGIFLASFWSVRFFNGHQIEAAVASLALHVFAFSLGLMALVAIKAHPGSLTHRFCPNCRTRLVKKNFDGFFKSACPQCAYVHWNNPITVGVMVVPHGEDGVVLVKRKYNPKAGEWALPGGFGETNECPDKTAVRETAEEANLHVEIDRLLGVIGTSDCNQTIVFYLAKPTYHQPSPGSDALEARVFKFDELPEIAFPAHAHILEGWINEVRRTDKLV